MKFRVLKIIDLTYRRFQMPKRGARSGGKYGGDHTTVIPAAGAICDIANACPHVTRISPGFLKTGLKTNTGPRRVKLTRQNGGILLSVRDSISHQEIRVYTGDVQEAMLAIARGARNAGFRIAFGNADPT
ncbi:DUF2103 domain-containing protein [Candidatus Wolfebacteria bacterium]|nr:DUF2103 domain-containing protein [Candidatus Wolfebacteria bacterium]